MAHAECTINSLLNINSPPLPILPESLCSGEGTFLSDPERDLPPPLLLPVLPALLDLRDGEPAVRGRTTSVKNVFMSPDVRSGREVQEREEREGKNKARG